MPILSSLDSRHNLKVLSEIGMVKKLTKTEQYQAF